MTVTDDEARLVEQAQRGVEPAFDALVRAALPRMRGVVIRLIGHPEDTEDIVQQALLKAWRGIGGFRRASTFSTWITGIAVRLAIDHLRAAKRWRREAQVAYANLCAESEELSGEVMGAFGAPDFSFEVREHVAYCFTCVGRSLPPDEQAALVLRDVLDLSNREASNVLGTSEAVLRHRLAAARKAMEDRYEGLCALVNKQGICHQCKGLSDVAAMAGGAPAPLPDIDGLAQRMAIVRSADPVCGRTRALHDVFWRRTKEIEEAELGSTEPISDCGQV
ncbi:MAG: RNA polymerase sigma factor [Inquilinaceae bacterium]